MNTSPEGNAIVYCQDAFNTLNGKTAHGLVRFTNRYKVLSVIDSKYAGQDSGMVLDGKPNNIPIFSSMQEAIINAKTNKKTITHFVVGLAPDGGRLDPKAKEVIKAALRNKFSVDCGLHDYLTEDEEIKYLADRFDVKIRDIRKPPHRKHLHFFSGKIEEVTSLKIAMLGTDSAIGKRTTAWILVNALNELGYTAEMIGTGQTAWLQGAKFSIVLDSLVNDFVSGEIEHAVHSAWSMKNPDVIVIEGQGSLLNPAYPGGFEILAAARPDIIILQHAPARLEYDGFPGYKLHPLEKQIEALEIISGKPVVAITINHENMSNEEIENSIVDIYNRFQKPAFDVLKEGGQGLAKELIKLMGLKAKKKNLETV
ncbi:MAG: DUF1611 domain-containing protein [Bacteroidetes bacterium]|nr:DUF1611 domain-containing protein [Bacteroidota bacterium]